MVRQFVGLEIAALIGIDKFLYVVSSIGDVHTNAGRTRAVVEAHVALHAARMLALTHLHLSLGGGDAFALVSRTYLVFIYSQGRHGLVLVSHQVKVGSHLFPLVIALALYSA